MLHIHSILGVLVFATGLLQILLKKEGARHRITGQVYLYSWLFILISGAYLGGPIITIVGIFGFYFALTGARIGRLKNKGITLFEKAIFSLGGLVSVVMLYYSVFERSKLLYNYIRCFWSDFSIYDGRGHFQIYTR
jgi:hypothetical protein